MARLDVIRLLLVVATSINWDQMNANGIVNKYKARLVVKGFAQIQSVDYSNTFVLVTRLDVIKLLLVASQMNWRVYQLEVKSTFFNGYLQEEIYVDHPERSVK